MIYRELSMDEIVPPAHAVRAVIDEDRVRELAESIQQVGLLSPILVKHVRDKFEVVAGHRRYLACNLLALAVVPCLVLPEATDLGVSAKIHENLFREDISPVEEAAFYAELLPEFGDDCDRLAQAVKRPRAHVEGRLNLLHGDPKILQALAEKQISIGVAEALNRLVRAEDRTYYLGWAIGEGSSVARVREWVRQANLQADFNTRPPAEYVPPPGPQGVDSPEPVCYICGHTEPRHDVEFWYIHKTCRMIAANWRQPGEQSEYRRPEPERNTDGGEGSAR